LRKSHVGSGCSVCTRSENVLVPGRSIKPIESQIDKQTKWQLFPWALPL
jgi:hypothetical protein